MTNVRAVTCKILELMDEGALSAHAVAYACLAYMSEDEVADMARLNELIVVEEDSEEDIDQDPMDDFNYVGSRHHY